MKPNEKAGGKMASTDSRSLAFALVRKMVAYQNEIDRKTCPSKAEQRHVAFLRALRNAGLTTVEE